MTASPFAAAGDAFDDVADHDDLMDADQVHDTVPPGLADDEPDDKFGDSEYELWSRDS